MADMLLEDVRFAELRRPDGRTVAWSEWGPADGDPLLRLPGTPGCRFSGLRADRSPWRERRLRVIMTERPGYGASSRLPGRGFVEPADDLAAILDQLQLERVHVIGGSGGGPHVLALAARHPDRVKAATVVVGAAPLTEDELGGLIAVNAESHRLIRAGDLDGFRRLLERLRASLLEDPIRGLRAAMDKAPEADRAVMGDPDWQATHALATREALRAGVDGWFDEGIALERAWSEIDLSAIGTSLTWWLADSDANVPLSAAQRLLERIPDARPVLFGPEEGHFAPYHREADILDELLARG